MGQLRLLGEPPASDDHAALANLAFPQAGHTGFVAAAGLAGGQTIIGGQAASEHLTLQSTAHAARGYVRAQDDLQLLSNIIRDSGGNQRLALAAASPHLTLTGDAKITGNLALHDGTPNAGYGLYSYKANPGTFMHVRATPQGAATGDVTGFAVYPSGLVLPNAGTFRGVAGFAVCSVASGATSGVAQGLYFYGGIAGGGPGTTFSEVTGARVRTAVSGYTGSLMNLYSLCLDAPSVSLGAPAITTTYGIFVGDQGPSASQQNAYGIYIGDMTLATGFKRLLEVGPPYLRVTGGGAPGANLTNLYLAEGATPTLRRVQWVDPGNGGANLVAGQRVMVLV